MNCMSEKLQQLILDVICEFVLEGLVIVIWELGWEWSARATR